ncbi:DNA polymerase III subunit gamma/tau [Enorma phocaeensis]|uniref:DNA polymerase III subunit gamma/tau n=1 Tax=Enorma phocaeensis TaxID=1871019 RepID=UPI001957B02E|nr:DNA polymerase III subunit gamma/tau [Enorma phocaeensis]
MESLYRKYRPLTFESVVGQQHIVSTLEHAVTEGRLSHAYLFCGPRGTGKTTMARILAKALLCERSAAAREVGASGCMPDGTCPECTQIAEGTHPDVYELDAASRTGVDNVREEIIGSVNFAPVRGAYKIYIIDEVHMLTTAAFNALLKTLEEPPGHVVFVLCTTDPQKIPETILSRCQRFDFHRIGNEDIVGRLAYICEQEGFDTEPEALEIVAKHARGGMRDALSTLEQLSVFGNGAVHVADARSLLGEVASSVLSEFCRGIAARDVPALFALIRTQIDDGGDLLELTRDLVAHVRDVYTARMVGAVPEVLDCTPEEAAALVDEASLFETSDRLARMLTVLDDAALEMRSAADTRLVLEIACTRLARPESDLTLEAVAERLDRLEARIASGVPASPLDRAGIAALTGGASSASAAPWDAAPASPAASAAPTRPAQAPRQAQSAPSGFSHETQNPARVSPAEGGAAASGASAAPSAGSVQAPSAPAAPKDAVPAPSAPAPASRASAQEHAPAVRREAAEKAAPAQARPAAPAAPSPQTAPRPAAAPAPATPAEVAAAAAAETPAVSDAGELQRKWSDVVRRVTAAQASRGALLQSSRARSDDGDKLVVAFPSGSAFAIKMLGRADTQEVVLPIVSAVFGRRTVEYVMDGGGQKASGPHASTPSGSGASGASETAAPQPSGGPSTSGSAASAFHVAPVSAERRRPAAPRGASAAPWEPAAPSSPAASPVPATSSPASAAPVSEAPAPAPSQKSPAPTVGAAPTPSSGMAPAAGPVADETSGPTIMADGRDIDADRRAWEEDQVPYDDAMIAGYEEEDLPPFDMPDAPGALASPAGDGTSSPATDAAPASSGGASASASGAVVPTSDDAVSDAGAPASPAAASAPAAPASPAVASTPAADVVSVEDGDPASASRAGVPFATSSPFANVSVDDTVPQTVEETKELLNSVFGAGVVLKGPADFPA